jgi:hypothetical protein
MRAAIVAAAIFAACQFTHGVNPNAPPPDGKPPPDGGPCKDVSVTCADSTTLRTCTMIGSDYQDTTCTWGCSTTGAAHCAGLVPSGGGVTSGDVMAGTFTGLMATTIGTPSSYIVDGTDGRIGTMFNSRQFRLDGTGTINGIDFELRGNVAVFRFASLAVSGPVTLVGPHPIAFVADGPIDIEDVIDARGPGCQNGTAGTNAGPGGFDGGPAQTDASGSGAGHGGGNNDDAGGGGGYGGMGGVGHNGKMGGMMFGDATISVLVGGGGGGGGKDSGGGGGGGGALQLISNAMVTIGAPGGINAGGCGGHSGGGGSHSGGGGGGAGGTILIEAVTIAISGALAVNGGGGGGNNAGGSAGTLDRNAGTGGDGGGTGAAANTSDGMAGAGNGAAGGGGIGRMRLNTLSGSASVDPASQAMSPNLSDATTCTQGVAVTQ